MFITLLTLAAAPLSVTAVADSYPAISPDGKLLVFQSNRTGPQGLWLSDAGGKNPRLIFTHRGEPSTPIWSRDSKTIIFAMRPDDAAIADETDIFSVDVNGENLRRLTSARGDDSHPHLSADGKRIFFNSTRETENFDVQWSKQKFGIYSIAIDGADVRLHFRCDRLCTYPSPSPDGIRVAYRQAVSGPGFDWEQNPAQGNSEVFIADLDGRNRRNISNHPAYDGWPAWSPDGKFVIFASARDGVPSTGQIFKADISNGAITPLTPSDGWSRAQPNVANTGSIYVYELKEDARTQLGHIARIDGALSKEE
jgi:TolB protein